MFSVTSDVIDVTRFSTPLSVTCQGEGGGSRQQRRKPGMPFSSELLIQGKLSSNLGLHGNVMHDGRKACYCYLLVRVQNLQHSVYLKRMRSSAMLYILAHFPQLAGCLIVCCTMISILVQV